MLSLDKTDEEDVVDVPGKLAWQREEYKERNK